MTTLADLEARVEELESKTAQRGASTLQPNVLTVAPDGTIGADFTGHVHARGLDLDASTISTPPDADRIRWLRTSDGAWVAVLFGEYVPGTPPSEAATFMLQDPDSGGGRSAALSLAYNNGVSTEVDATATFGGFTKVAKLIDSAGASSFLQLLSAQKLIQSASRAYRSAAGLALALGNNQVPLDGTSFDPAGHFSGGFYTCPATGKYQVLCTVSPSLPAGSTAQGLIWVNGVPASWGSYAPQGGWGAVATDIIDCNAGDAIRAGIWCSAGGGTVNTGSALTYMSVMQVPS